MRHEGHAGLAQFVTVGLDIDIGRQGRVGNDQIEAMQGQLGEQSVGRGAIPVR